MEFEGITDALALIESLKGGIVFDSAAIVGFDDIWRIRPCQGRSEKAQRGSQIKAGTIESIWRYPVKRMRGEEFPQIYSSFAGLMGV